MFDKQSNGCLRTVKFIIVITYYVGKYGDIL